MAGKHETMLHIVEDIFVPCLYKHLGTGNQFSMRFVYAFAAWVRAPAETVAVLHSKRKHVNSYSSYSKQLTRSEFGPSRIIYKYYAYIIPLSLCKYTLFFQKWWSFIFATSATSFVREQLSDIAYGIIFQAEKAATHIHINFKLLVYWKIKINLKKTSLKTWCSV